MADKTCTLPSMKIMSSPNVPLDFRFEAILEKAMNAVFDMAALVDPNGMVVLANEELIKTLRAENGSGAIGKRLGALARCSRHIESRSGCGKTAGCEYCGVNKAIKDCFTSGQPTTGEASLVLNDKDELIGSNLAVRATPLMVGDVPYAIVSLRDISAQKTRNYINSRLIHFLVDQIGGIQGLSGFLADNLDGVAHRDLALCIVGASGDALSRIQEYQQLVDAESGGLKPAFSDISIWDLVENLDQLVESSLKASISIDNRCAKDAYICSDIELLQRSLLKVIKCACEAQDGCHDVRLRVSLSSCECRFAVHHRSALDPRRKYAMYSRWGDNDSVSCNSLCAYICRLYVERYLGGSVSCRSSELFGTVYTIRVPTHRLVA